MRALWHDVWGCAAGPVMRLAPPTRLIAGIGVFASAMIVPVEGAAGLGVFGGAVAAWLAACRPSWRLLRVLLALALMLFAPYFLLAPFLLPAGGGGTAAWSEALRAPWAVFLRGTGGMLVSVATVTALGPGDLREALVRLPAPRLAAAIVLQVVHQLPALAAETKRIAAAMAVRGATGGGRAAVRVAVALPTVWLPRVLSRAERVGAAMELRGYDARSATRSDHTRLGFGDGVVLLVVAGVLVLTVVFRVEGVR